MSATRRARYWAAVEDDPIAEEVTRGARSHAEAARAAARHAGIGEQILTFGPRGGVRAWIAVGPAYRGTATGARPTSRREIA